MKKYILFLLGATIILSTVKAGTDEKKKDETLTVNLKDFRLKSLEGKVHLQWQVASNDTDYVFVLERYGDLEAPEKIALAKGSASPPQTLLVYSFIDESPYLKYNYYRLLIIKGDEVITRSNIVMIYIKRGTF